MPQIALIVPLGELPGLIPGVPGYPDQGLPGGGWAGRPSHPIAPGGRPIDPGFGNPGWVGGEHPGNRPPGSFPGFPARPDQGLPWPGRPVDPGFGNPGFGGGDATAGQLPIWPVDPSHPIAPPIPGEPELPPVDPPPGTVWPPLPPNIPAGKALAYAGIAGVGYRYVVIDIPENPPELPPRPQPKG
jgi:hypothetical protein